ncbi:hypothetical protein PHSY_002036 [Pseudozyma hubeiensis SY62]|uniref:Uncharacterized protein n=1 Tax=Pseudozyma hubeiensis (strain SY62) TaxID=1305764 RepID=R9P8Q5_PSEHS|nr:hypothetical protein PHSY_002036 [Pseudozyma hubeiensis SY62]GAC94465.1 hypothetical protein PHSY_002036 [Pseudozyma hubeiensis SY62]
MPTAIKSPFKPFAAAVSKYVTSHKARVESQNAAAGTASGPSGAEVDAHVASTLPRKQKHLANDSLADTPAVQVDDQGRTLGLEDPQDPALQPIPTTVIHATARPNIVPTTPVTDPALIAKVSSATYGKQTSIPLFPTPATTVTSNVDVNQYGFVDPRTYAGTSFDLVGDGLHEPLNVIVSSLSSPSILTKKGFQNYCRSLDFDKECLGLHAGGYQKAYVDPRGWLDQNFIYRQVYTPLDHVFGTCIESLVGGNHIRAWQQQGSGAWFLATSKEMTATKSHMIVPDGYNVGREELVKQALGKAKDGRTSFMFTRYVTEVMYVAGLMPEGVQGVNHDISVDGLTAVLTVTVVPESGLFGKKDVKEVPQKQDRLATDTVAASAATHHSDHQARLRRTSLAKRFSLSRAPGRRQSEEQQSTSPPVWQRLSRMSVPKGRPADQTPRGEAGAENGTTAVLSADVSVSTLAEASEPVAPTSDASKAHPTGLPIPAPAIAA